MKKLVLASVLALATVAQAYVVSDEARLVQKFEKDGVLTEVYMQQTYADETTFCSQLITLKYEVATKKLISSTSKESCSRH